MKKLACCVAWVIALLCSHSSHAVLPYRQNIKLNEFGGEIHGSLEEDGTHSTFYGVSYAQSPPTRFKTAQPSQLLADFVEEIDASSESLRGECPQLTLHPRTGNYVPPVKGSEDCLKLNIYTNSLSTSERALYPVLVIVHDSLTQGPYETDLQPKNFFAKSLDNKMVVITVSSRVGPMGFLTLGGGEIAGNIGFLDQVLALKWIQANIHHFGGDKDRVTLMGRDAPLHHLVSPMSEGLFKKVISHSGVLHRPSKDPVAAGFAFAEKLGCTESGIAECLAKLPLEALMEASNMFETYMHTGNPWHVVVDQKLFPQEPIERLTNGRVNQVEAVLHGGVMNEGAILMPQFVNNQRQTIGHLSENFASFGPHLLFRMDLEKIVDEDTATAELLVHEYLAQGLDQNLTTVGNTLYFRDLLTDMWYLMPIDQQINHISQKVPETYYYNYRYKGSLTTTRDVLNIDTPVGKLDFGVGHMDDLYAMSKLRNENLESKKSADDARMADKLTKLWVAFVTGESTSQPDSAWIRVDPEEADWIGPNYAVLDLDQVRMMREDTFQSKVDLVSSLLSVQSAFRDMDLEEHPAVKNWRADQEEELKEETKEAAGVEDADMEEENNEGKAQNKESNVDDDLEPSAKTVLDSLKEQFSKENMDAWMEQFSKENIFGSAAESEESESVLSDDGDEWFQESENSIKEEL